MKYVENPDSGKPEFRLESGEAVAAANVAVDMMNKLLPLYQVDQMGAALAVLIMFKTLDRANSEFVDLAIDGARMAVDKDREKRRNET